MRQPKRMYCPRCGEQTLHKIEECSRDRIEVKSSFSCLACDNEDIVYIVTPLSVLEHKPFKGVAK